MGDGGEGIVKRDDCGRLLCPMRRREFSWNGFIQGDMLGLIIQSLLLRSDQKDYQRQRSNYLN